MIDPAITKAEELIARYHKLQPSTRRMREKFMIRILKGNVPSTRSIGYWRNYLASLQLQVAVSSEPLIDKAKAGDQDAIRQINRGIKLLDGLEKSRPAIEERKPRQGRMKTLSRLRKGWQEAIFEHLPEKWQQPVAVLATTGCRPAELQGLEVLSTGQEGILKFRIWGKKVNAKSGQEWREITVDVGVSAYGRSLLQQFGNVPGKINFDETTDGLRKAITRAARRAKIIPKNRTVPPYAFRNAVASGMKAESFDILDIAGALGHSSDECQKYYGRASAGHKSGGGQILTVETSRPVRRTGRTIPQTPKTPKHRR